MDEHVVGVTGIRIHAAKNRWDKMAHRLRPIRIGDIDRPKPGIFPGAEDDVSFDHALDVVNAEAPPRPVGRAEAIER